MSAGAQSRAPVAVGSRVRVQSRAGDSARIVTGNLAMWEGDTIALLTPPGVEQRIPLAHITRMDVSRGRGLVMPHMLIGAGTGTAAGMVVGGVVGSNSCKDCVVQALTTITGTIVGGMIGAAGGSVRRSRGSDGAGWR